MGLKSTNITGKKSFWIIPFTFVICFFLSSFVFGAEDTTESIHYRLGVKYKNEKKYDEAIEEFRKVLAEEGAVVAGGLAAYAGKMFRIGHMGNIDDHTVYSAIAAIERTLIRLGHKYEVGIGLKTLLEKM